MKSIPPDYGRRAFCPCFHRVASVCAILLCGVVRVNAVPPTVMVVDIIPEALSSETDPNSEPNLAVNPANPSQIAASAYLPEPMGGNKSSILVSSDGGATWSCRSTVPIDEMQCDVTLRFGGFFNMLYLAALNDSWDFLICRSNELARHRMDDSPLRQLGSYKDQPYITAATIDKRDRVFVGVNDWDGPPGRTATVVRSLDGIARPPNCNFTHVPIEFAASPPPLLRDDAEIRPAVSGDGKKVYAVFNRLSSITGKTRVGDVILVRDDDGGNSGAASFTGLDAVNGVAGFPAVKGRTFLFDWDDGTTHYAAELGGDRLGGDLAIAVDPRNANNVYLVWGEVLANQPVLHVSRSTNGGQQWSGNLYTIVNAKNPGLAINTKGTLAFLYQRVVSPPMGREIWVTQLELTNDDFQTVTSLPLSRFPAAEIASISGQPRLGDYLHLMAVGDVFYGIFSASNVPDQSRFPYGVSFQRYKDLATKKLLDKHGNEVPSSVDPFFFKVIP